MLAAGLLLGYYPVAGTIHCIVNGFLLFACAVVFMFTLAAISLDRYLCVAWRHQYQRLVSRRTSAVVCLAIWALAALVCLPSAIDGTIGFDPKTHMCFLKSLGVFTTGHAVTIGTVMLTLIVVGILNFLIYRVYIKSRQRVGMSIHALSGCAPDLASGPSGLSSVREQPRQPRQDSRLSNSDIVLLRSLLTVFLVFFVLTSPATVVFVIRNTVYIDPFLYGIFIWLYAINNSVNWIIYGLMNSRFRQGYKRAARNVKAFLLQTR